MWLEVTVPVLDGHDAVWKIVELRSRPGDHVRPGDVLADITMDLSAGSLRDCPPISACRVVLEETAWVREVTAQGEAISPGGLVALLSTEPGSPPEPPRRRARVTVAAILRHEDWWRASE